MECESCKTSTYKKPQHVDMKKKVLVWICDKCGHTNHTPLKSEKDSTQIPIDGDDNGYDENVFEEIRIVYEKFEKLHGKDVAITETQAYAIIRGGVITAFARMGALNNNMESTEIPDQINVEDDEHDLFNNEKQQ